ncbi:MAG: hypothetical protein AMXMBFR64_17630 [Myxococcales bacterium]
MTLRTRLLLALLIPGLLVVLVGAIGLLAVDQLGRAAERILANNYHTIQAARQMETALLHVETGAAGDHAARFEEALVQCERNVTEPGEPAVLAGLRAAWGAASGRVDPETAAGLRQGIADLVTLNEAAMIASERRARETAHTARLAVAGALAATVVALVGFALLAARRIGGPVTEVAARLHAALGAGGPVPPPPTDELGRLQGEVDALLGRLAAYEDAQARRLSHALEESRRRFVSMLSHQLKTPMTSLSLSVHLLRERLTNLDPAQAELLAIAGEDCDNLAALIAELIDASRDVAPDLTVRVQPVELAPLLRTALRPLLPQAEASGISLALPEGGMIARVDPVKFPWVVTNIAGNALRYTPRGGSVRVAVAAMEGGVEVTVADTGAGIPAEALPRIFDPFVSADAAPQAGTHGLGLAIAREIVSAHRGRISVESRVGEGTTFRIHIPVTAERT